MEGPQVEAQPQVVPAWAVPGPWHRLRIPPLPSGSNRPVNAS